MPALKLFVSHSSRLDDVEHQYTSQDHNWRLLEDTCKAIRQEYGDRVEVLVDKDGLVPGDDWNHRLNLWLAECHVAIILFSKRAIEKSAWVAKEAAILSWRAELDDKFILIPVMLDGESTPEDLARDFLGVLKIGTNQCIRNVKTAGDILAGIVQKLGAPEDLAGAYPQTPLELLQEGIAEILDDKTTAASLRKALADVGCPKPSPPTKRGCATLLAREFLRTTPGTASACFRTFKSGLSPLTPEPSRERAKELFKYIRPLWVEPADAASLRMAQGHRHLLALNGHLIGWSDKELGTRCYTLERFIERAWPGPESGKFLPVPLPKVRSVPKAQEERFGGAFSAVARFRPGPTEPYVFSDDIVIAVDVALATTRPLLVSSNPSSGKSRLADAVAAVQGWNLLAKTMTSRTRLESLTAEVDQLRRLNDAQAHGEGAQLKPDACYLNPGIFWWAFRPATARRRGMPPAQAQECGGELPYPGVERGGSPKPRAVLLIDEIDKAEPDLPNDLLEPLDRRRFDLPDGFHVEGASRIDAEAGIGLLTVITNSERELPQAFLRRCVTLDLPDPSPDKLVQIALRHIPGGRKDRMEKIAARIDHFRTKANDLRRRPPGTAEFLDAIRACEELKIEVSDAEDSIWKKIENAVLVKDTRA